MKPLTKNLWRNIRDSLGRFIAIVIIIMLGVLLFVGVKATGPALKDSLNTTVKADHLADSQLLATTGVSKAQVKAAESVSGVQAEAVKFKYVIGGRASDVVALYGYQKGTTINRLHLTSGQLPTQANQIVLDTAAKKSGYQLGQTYTFTGGSKLARRTFKISGFADSPAYIEDTSRGSANIGDGTVRYFAYIPASQMKMPVASQLNIRFPALQTRDTFSNRYKDAVATKMKLVKQRVKAQGEKDLRAAVYANIVKTATAKAQAQLAPRLPKNLKSRNYQPFSNRPLSQLANNCQPASHGKLGKICLALAITAALLIELPPLPTFSQFSSFLSLR